jgi:membrane-associated phospholipid phosphatase
MTANRRFADWPGCRHLGRTLVLGLALSAWFAAIYGGADWLTHRRSTRFRVHLDFETGIPFVGSMTVGYLSIYPLFWLGPFVLRRPSELHALVKVLGLTTLCGGIGFLLLPAELAYGTPAPSSPWASMFALADRVNLNYNLVPSLHVALATACVAVYARYAGTTVAVGLWTWCAVIAASTVLTHQHHLLDVATGFLLGLVLGRVVYPRYAAPDAASAVLPADSTT